MKDKINVTKTSMPKYREFKKEIRDLWKSCWITNMGTKHNELESELSKYLQTSLTLFANGHLALEAAIDALSLSGEVITTPFTFSSTTHAIVRKQLVPVFCDISYDDYNMDSDKIESLITDKTSAILPVHVYGNVCNVDKIEQIAEKYKLKVIYDAAHAFGVSIQGKGIASFGDASIFSFHATKVFNTIEGGAVAFQDEALRSDLNRLKNFGITGPESVESIGGNAKMNEFQAAMGLCNLRLIDNEIAKRKRVSDRYSERLRAVKGIKLNPPAVDATSNYAYYPVLFDGFKYNRDEVYNKLRENNIYSRKYFYPLTSDYQCYQNKFDSSKTPVAKYIAERILTIPLYSELALKDVDRICDVILA